MKILIATGIYPPDIGGPATYTVLMEKELPKHGFVVDHLAFTEYRKRPKIVRHLLYFWDCWKKAKNFDAVYAQDPVSVGLPALAATRLRGKKFFIRVAGDYAWEQSAQRFAVKDTIDDFQNKRYGLRVWVLRAIQRFVVGRADLVVTPSNYFRKLVGGWIKNPDKVKTIYNGVRYESVFGATRGLNTLVSIGRLVPWKGFDFLIRLMATSELSDFTLRIIGDGPDRERLAGIVKELRLDDRVRLLGDVSRDIMLKDISNAGIFVLNTKFESFSFVIAEAMNAGAPIIATRIGSIPELIEDGKEGILVEPDNKEQILAAVGKIRSDSGFRNNIVAAAHGKAQDFTIERTVDNLVKLINDSTSR